MLDPTQITRLARACAAHIDPARSSFDQALPEFNAELRELFEALKLADSRYIFDRDGRPGAIGAVRSALPAVERELFDAVIEDCECELMATREALFQVMRQIAPSRGAKGG